MGRSGASGLRIVAVALALSAALLSPACAPGGNEAAAQEAGLPVQGQANTGQPASPAFIVDFAKGFDPATQYLTDNATHGDWISSAHDPKNAHFRAGVMALAIEKRPYKGKPNSGSEFLRQGMYGYGRYEVVMKPPGGSGLVSSFFTYTGPWQGDPHDEIDIEFLGKNTRQLHLNYFRDGREHGSIYIDLPFDYTEDFHIYAFEWTPGRIRWFVDGEQVHEASGLLVPTTTGMAMASVWSGGPPTVEWLGPNKWQPGAAAVYRCMSHVPMGQTGAQCADSWPATR